MYFAGHLGFWKLLLYELHNANVGYGVHEVVFLEEFPSQTQECLCCKQVYPRGSSVSPLRINCTHMLRVCVCACVCVVGGGGEGACLCGL